MENAGARSSAWTDVATGCLFLAALAGCGFVVGVAVATRLLSTSGMGWDQLADALGGGLAGGVLGLVAGALSVRRASRRLRLILALAFLVAAALCLVLLRTTSPRTQARALDAQSYQGAGLFHSPGRTL